MYLRLTYWCLWHSKNPLYFNKMPYAFLLCPGLERMGWGHGSCDKGLTPCQFEPHRLSMAAVDVFPIVKDPLASWWPQATFPTGPPSNGQHIVSWEFSQKGKRVVMEKILIHKLALVWILLPCVQTDKSFWASIPASPPGGMMVLHAKLRAPGKLWSAALLGSIIREARNFFLRTHTPTLASLLGNKQT